MRIIDISQELFSCSVYPGDARPERKIALSIENGDIVNLTEFSMCAHNGTHIDAPYHFYKDGKTVDKLALSTLVGKCFVCYAEGAITDSDAENIMKKAKKFGTEASKRILVAGNAYVTIEAARVFTKEGILLFGNESQSVGPIDAPAEVHYELLGHGVVLLEGIRIFGISEGVYMLNAAPINLGACDGAPCRAILISE